MKIKIKRILCLLTVLSVFAAVFAGCGNKVTVAVPLDGVGYCTALITDKLKSDGAELGGNYAFSYHKTDSAVKKAFLNGDADVAVMSADSAAKLLLSEKDLVCVAVVSLSDCALYGYGESRIPVSRLERSSIYINGANSSAEVALSRVMRNAGLNMSISAAVRYKDSNSELREALKGAGDRDFVLACQPFATTVIRAATTNKLFDIAEEFSKAEPDILLVGDCVVTHKKFAKNNKKLLSELITEIKNSEEKAKLDTQTTAALAVKYGINKNSAVAASVIYGSNFKTVSGDDLKTELQKYYNFIADENINVIGKLPTDDFYYNIK